ncbi:MAG: hypothetical protein IKG40_04185 [Bacilli bacterium]|nr:hypothetical protein [Bacilli bacterium]
MKETNLDVFSEFDELDSLDNTYEYTFSNFQDLIDEAKKQKEEIIMNSFEAPLEEELNKTSDISLIKDDILDKLDEMINEPIIKTEENITLKNDNSLQKAFIYTSIVGFILLMISWGIYLYIITH